MKPKRHWVTSNQVPVAHLVDALYAHESLCRKPLHPDPRGPVAVFHADSVYSPAATYCRTCAGMDPAVPPPPRAVPQE